MIENKNKINKKKICFAVVSIVLMTISLFVNPSGYISEYGNKNFDCWSESILISDMQYNKKYNCSTVFIKQLNSEILTSLFGGKTNEYENTVKNDYINGSDKYEESGYSDYLSNIVIQRYFYRFINSHFDISNSIKVNIFYLMNCALLAITVTVILTWIIKVFNNYWYGIIMLAVLSTCAPSLLMYGKNLYWCAWTLFLPAAMTASALNTKIFNESKHKTLILSIVAFAAIFIKCLFYFEFVTTVMIAMMIPVLYYLITYKDDDYTVKKRISSFIIISLFAVLALVAVNVIKFLMLTSYCGNTSDAMSIITENFAKRITGKPDASNAYLAESAKASYLYVIAVMLIKPFADVKNLLNISQLALAALTAVCTVFIICFSCKYNRPYKNKAIAWSVCTWTSILAPLSWMILAKPHTFIHNLHCSINWFNIFDFMAVALIIMSAELIISDLVCYIKNNSKKLQNK